MLFTKSLFYLIFTVLIAFRLFCRYTHIYSLFILLNYHQWAIFMHKISCSINKDPYEKILKMAKNEQRSVSSIGAELIEFALKIKSKNEESDQNSEDKLWEDLFKDQVKVNLYTLETVREILRMTFNQSKSSQKDAASPETIIENIRNKMTKYVDGRTKKEV